MNTVILYLKNIPIGERTAVKKKAKGPQIPVPPD